LNERAILDVSFCHARDKSKKTPFPSYLHRCSVGSVSQSMGVALAL
jgi:hypothetical protein